MIFPAMTCTSCSSSSSSSNRPVSQAMESGMVQCHVSMLPVHACTAVYAYGDQVRTVMARAHLLQSPVTTPTLST
jgi:hypothetical protein